ncbi:MAG: OsmC family protein [Phycisphaerales bacterium]
MTMMQSRTSTDPQARAKALEAHQRESRARCLNGIDLEQLRGAISAIEADAAAGQTRWNVRSQWMGGTRSDHQVEGFEIGGQFVRRPFTIKIDEPHELTGSNEYANPQEHLLAAMNACMMVGYAAVAGLMGMSLSKLEVVTEGEIDLRGFLGIDSATPAGYPKLRQTVHIAGDGTPEQFAQLHETVKATSPNFYNITRAVEADSRLIVQ